MAIGRTRTVPAAMLLALASVACRAATPAEPAPSPTPPTAEPTTDEAPARSTEQTSNDAAPLPVEPPETAKHLSAGVAVHWLRYGNSEERPPHRGDRLEMTFSVWDEDGKLVGASAPGKTEILEAGWLPPGWMLAMESMHEGDHAHVWVPAAMAYPKGDGPRGSLRIDVELVAIHPFKDQVFTAESLLQPPPNALRTASGLAFLVLREGKGTVHPRRNGTVTVHYEGWTTDGNRFDSSVERGRPATFPLDRVIEGWQEAVPLMVEGEKTRFWIPADLAYGDKPGRPQGMLVFDIELLSIDD